MKGKFKLIKVFSKIHGNVLRISRGRAWNRFKNIEFILLTTVGSKSGKERSVPLVAIPLNGSYILIASFGGSNTHPAWFINIMYNSKVSIRIGAVVKNAKASIIEKSDSRYEDMWAKAVAVYPGYDEYKKATTRHIPIVVISLF